MLVAILIAELHNIAHLLVGNNPDPACGQIVRRALACIDLHAKLRRQGNILAKFGAKSFPFVGDVERHGIHR
jgi:hypothetical protein